jgi:hypothetical protein
MFNWRKNDEAIAASALPGLRRGLLLRLIMNLLYPTLPAAHWKRLAFTALAGSLLAGLYGAAHDQLSYTLSPEYFTKLKVPQFWYADFGWPPRVFAAEVGFLAGWGVGLIAGWLLARVGLTRLSDDFRRAATIRAFAIVAGVTLLGGGAGLLLGYWRTEASLEAWSEWQRLLHLDDLRGFVLVASLHAGSYAGALLGLVAAIWNVRRGAKHATSLSP